MNCLEYDQLYERNEVWILSDMVAEVSGCAKLDFSFDDII